jgi:hypothetical protein
MAGIQYYYYYYYYSISACSPRAGTNNIHICAPLLGKQKRGGDCRKTKRGWSASSCRWNLWNNWMLDPMKSTKMHAASTCALLSRLFLLPASGLANECFAYFVCRRSVKYVIYRSQGGKACFLRVTHYSSINPGVKAVSREEDRRIRSMLFISRLGEGGPASIE